MIRRHVFADLEPYVCTRSDCTEPDRMYSSQNAWFLHEAQHHDTLHCGVSDHEAYAEPLSFVNHLGISHDVHLDPNNAPSLEVFRRPTKRERGVCNLCGSTTDNLKQHIGRHLQRMALFAVPRSMFVPDEEEQRGKSDISISNVVGSQLADSEADTFESEDDEQEDSDKNYDEAEDDTDLDHLAPDTDDVVSWVDVKPVLQQQPYFFVPPGFRPNSLFVGFELQLESIENYLSLEAHAETTKAVLVSGSAGSGKTQLVREYIFRHRGSYHLGVFWFDASTTRSLRQTLSAARELLDHGLTSMSELRAYLQKREGWILVFDDIDVSTTGEPLWSMIGEIVPVHSSGHVIFTSWELTSMPVIALSLHAGQLNMEPLDLVQATDLVLKSLDIKDPTPDKLEAATRVYSLSKGLPLAIHAIVQSLKANGTALEEYTEADYSLDSRHDLTNAYTSICNEIEVKSHGTANILYILVFYCTTIPISLLHYGFAAQPSETAALLFERGLRYKKSSLQDAIAILSGYHFVDVREEPSEPSLTGHEAREGNTELESADRKSSIRTLAIDAVAQDAVRKRLRHLGMYTEWLRHAAVILCQSFSKAQKRVPPSRRKTADYIEYERQAETVWSHFPTSSVGASRELRKARNELDATRRQIKRAVQHCRWRSSGSQGSTFLPRKEPGTIFTPLSSLSSGASDMGYYVYEDEGDLSRDPSLWSDEGELDQPLSIGSEQHSLRAEYDVQPYDREVSAEGPKRNPLLDSVLRKGKGQGRGQKSVQTSSQR